MRKVSWFKNLSFHFVVLISVLILQVVTPVAPLSQQVPFILFCFCVVWNCKILFFSHVYALLNFNWLNWLISPCVCRILSQIGSDTRYFKRVPNSIKMSSNYLYVTTYYKFGPYIQPFTINVVLNINIQGLIWVKFGSVKDSFEIFVLSGVRKSIWNCPTERD